MEENFKINWYRCKADKTVMRDLMRKSDARAFAQVIPQLLLYVLTGTVAYLAFLQLNATTWTWALPLLLLALFAHGTFTSFFGGIACHELCHKTPFATQTWNTVFLRIYAFLSWFDPVGYRASHIRHHQVTVHDDHDGEVELPKGLDWHGVKFFLSVLTFRPKVVANLFRYYLGAAIGDFSHDGFFNPNAEVGA